MFTQKIIKSLTLMALILSVPSIQAQQALTPEQITQRVNVLIEAAKKTNTSVQILDRDMKLLQKEMIKVERLVDNKAMLEMLQRVEVLSDEMSQLRGELEQQGFDLADLKKRQRELYLDIDRRLRSLESGNVSRNIQNQAPETNVASNTTASNQAVVSSNNSTTGNKTSVDVTVTQPEISTPSVASSDTSTTQAISNSSSKSVVTSSEERDAYQAAFDTLKEGRYKNAKTEFNAFLQKFPTSGYAGNAQYWLGEAHYVTRNFPQSIIEFEKVLASYSSSNKVPDAMLKLGYTHYELRQYEQAKAILGELSERFPTSTAARLAGKRLERIRKEGH